MFSRSRSIVGVALQNRLRSRDEMTAFGAVLPRRGLMSFRGHRRRGRGRRGCRGCRTDRRSGGRRRQNLRRSRHRIWIRNRDRSWSREWRGLWNRRRCCGRTRLSRGRRGCLHRRRRAGDQSADQCRAVGRAQAALRIVFGGVDRLVGGAAPLSRRQASFMKGRRRKCVKGRERLRGTGQTRLARQGKSLIDDGEDPRPGRCARLVPPATTHCPPPLPVGEIT